MNKVALFPFRDEPMCFIHVLLNAQDMNAKGFDVKIIMEGAAVTLIPLMEKEDNPLHGPYMKTKSLELFEGACRACSTKLGVADAVEAAGISLIGDVGGHPGMAAYMEQGYQIITF